MGEKELFLLKEVFTKIEYDKTEGKYILPIDAYIKLNLSQEDFQLLDKMCQENGIELKKLPRRLRNKETVALFKEYNDLKTKKTSAKNSDELKQIEQKIIDIRNKIAEGHLEVAYKLITNFFPNIEDRKDKEDIYQTGYELLINFIDSYDMSLKRSFREFLGYYLIRNLIRKVGLISDDLNKYTNERLSNINQSKEQLEYELQREVTLEELATYLGEEVRELEELLHLAQIINFENLDEELAQIDEAGSTQMKELIDDTFEEKMIDQTAKEYLLKLLKTIPEKQSQAIILYYGLDRGRSRTLEEVANITGTTVDNVRQLINVGIYRLRRPVRSKYIEDYYETGTTKELKRNRKDIEIEELLIKQLPKEYLLELVNEASPKHRLTLLMFFGLSDGTQYSRLEISKKLGLTIATVNTRIANAMEEIKRKIKYDYRKRNNYQLVQDKTYMEYILNYYLNMPKKKR